jgi:hypothetical protein
MTSTRDSGRPRQLKDTAREALGNAKRRRAEGKPHHAAAELARAAQARETLLAEYTTPGLERELANLATGDARRRALAAHLLNSGKAKPGPG